MTGFGKAVGNVGSKKITIEIRSLNGKQLDASVKLPGIYKEKELLIRKLLSKKLERGKVDMLLYYESLEEERSHSINKETVRSYYTDLKVLNQEIEGDSSTDFLSIIMKMPDVFKTEHAEFDDTEWGGIWILINEAVDKLNQFRIDEGTLLEKDLSERVNAISVLLNDVNKYENERIKIIKDRIAKHLEETVGKENVDQSRFEQEMIYFLEKLDISEEKVRLSGHLDYFIKTMNESRSQGKKLGFISQEMGREINTTGSKANHTGIQKLVVEMKDELEKIKEQVLNTL